MRIAQAAGVAAEYAKARWRWRALRGEALARYQEERAREIVRFAAERAPFYRAHWAGRDLAEWRTLPTVDKRLMMEHFDTFNTLGVTLAETMGAAVEGERSRDFRTTVRGATVGMSSGTSGHRGLFVVSPREQTVWAGTILARALHEAPLRRGGFRVALFLRANSNLYERTHGGLVRFQWFDLMTRLPESVAALNEYRPHLLIGPPSMLGFLADAREAGTLHVAPERLVSVAEVLEPQDGARLERVFGAPVHQIYQCTEGLLGVSCRAGSLHVQEDLVALQLEPLDADRVTPIVTDLRRTSQPIVRYRLNDVLRMESAPCRCGSPWRVIRAIEGRADDVVYLESNGGGTRTFFPDTIRRMVLLGSPDIDDYQAFQERPGHLRVHLALRPGADFAAAAATVRESVRAVAAQYDARPPELHLEPGLAPVPPGAKRRRVQRLG
ncbi:MAG TPA: F390 synthetase-related protein [Longimicrobium sp.]|nr:F390 synthetase-related protein [Longimicrobium sp.]